MDLSNEADIKGSPETKSNEDSGVEVKIVNKNYLANSNLYFSKIKLKIKICFPQKIRLWKLTKRLIQRSTLPLLSAKRLKKENGVRLGMYRKVASRNTS